MPEVVKLSKHRKISGVMTCVTGLHIGGSREDLQIGGTDSPVIRDPITGRPYIPGSSIKGKLRSILELKLGRFGIDGSQYRENRQTGRREQDGRPCGCRRPDCLACTMFGPHQAQQHSLGPSRIFVRDAFLHEDSIRLIEESREQGLDYLEEKTETAVDRWTGVAGGGSLRNTQRVPPGFKFRFEIVLRVFEGDDEALLVDTVKDLLTTLESSEYLGGAGSRGYGKIRIEYEE